MLALSNYNPITGLTDVYMVECLHTLSVALKGNKLNLGRLKLGCNYTVF